MADLNTKSLAKDRHLSLLHTFGFCLQWRICRRDRVCKSIQIGQAKTSKSNQMAKQSFRALSIFSVMSLAEGNHFPNLLQMIHEGSPNALSWWCSTWSPINMISTALLFILAVPPVGIQQTHEGSGWNILLYLSSWFQTGRSTVLAMWQSAKAGNQEATKNAYQQREERSATGNAQAMYAGT